MGLMDALFGGSKTVDLNDDQIKGVANDLINYDPGLGAAGKMAKGYLKAIRQGRMTDLPGVQLAMAQGQRNWTDLQRELRMNSAMMPGEQSGLYAGMLQTGMLKNQDQTGLHALTAAANDISNFASIYNLARQGRINAELTGKQAGAGILQNGKRRVETKGILGGLAGLAGTFAGAAAGIPSLGGGSGGGGGWNPNEGGFCWVAGELYGEGSIEQQRIRHLLLTTDQPDLIAFRELYKQVGESWAKTIKVNPTLRESTQALFDSLLSRTE